ncbi:MAG TPA: acetyltransferase [Thermoanaerobaculia bacterium]|nr:acetyltransferase [Thermoanaerobaculia bacterium]
MFRGIAVILLLILNTAFWGTLVLLGGLVKLLVPKRESRRNLRMFMAELGDRWAGANNAVFDRMLTTQWDVAGLEGLRIDAHYLIISNHVSWVDIFVLFRVFHRRAPFIRFFLKRVLIWFPVAGQACWAMDFPFMRRYTAEYLERHPERRGRDLETTRVACRRYRRIPVSILNFLEGTRFTREKHADQESPYRHLLRPRVSGIAFVLASLSEQLDSIVDVTIAYPTSEVTMWDFVTSRIRKISVRMRRLDTPGQFLTSDITEPGPARDAFKIWVEQLWHDKDETIEGVMYRGTLVP